MKGQSNFGYKLVCFIALIAAIASAAARGYRPFYTRRIADPDSTAKAIADSTEKAEAARKLRFPIYDKTGEPFSDARRPSSIDLQDPKNMRRGFEYDADSNRFNYNDKLGNEFLRNPTYLTLDEYQKYRGKQDEDTYWQRRLDGLMLFNKSPELPQMYKEGLFDRIFGNNTISVKPQGNVDVTFGGNWQNIKNPTLTQRAQKYGVFDFDMQMNINLVATVGDKLKLNISNNTKATFDYQNVQKLDYSGKEDEMLKKIEAGNVSFPLKSNLISGVQSLFGLKTQLQFGKLWVTTVLSQQKSQRKSLTIQGGAQSQQILIKAGNYEENKNFLLAQYFHNHYNSSLKNFPLISSGINISKIEVWVTNKNGAVNSVRSVECFMDLGEAEPFKDKLRNPASKVRNGLPDNNANHLYTELYNNKATRQQSSSINALIGLNLSQGQDFEATTARQLTATEFSFNPALGFIMLNTQMNPEDVLGVAYRYTYKGQVYQVGEFASDLPPDTSNTKVLFLKLLKGTSSRPTLPVWKLMMKNIYALGGFGVSKDNFTLNILYQQPGGSDLRYLPEGPNKNVPLLTLLNLDRLNSQNEPSPDGIFDFVEGTTINTQQGKIIFPLLEPFGNDLKPSLIEPGSTVPSIPLTKKYIFQVLYDSTKTVALQSQQTDRYILKGTYKSSSSSDIFLGGFQIPPGSVSVSAGGTKLIENQDYTVDYGLGRIKIINTGIMSSGVPINIQFEDNATFGFQQQNFMGARLDYYLNKNLTLGGTIMRLNERPFTQQVNYGDDPIKNTVLGLDMNYQSEVAAITRALNVVPKIFSSSASSFINVNAEAAALLPGHPKQIDVLDPEGAVYIDNFEGTSSTYDLKFPPIAWNLSSAPTGAVDRNNVSLFPEAGLHDVLKYGTNRAKLAWYTIEPTLVDPGSSVPNYVKNDSTNQHYIRMVQQQDVFPNLQTNILSALSTFDLSFFPNQRGPYNFDATNIDNDGTLLNPQKRWGGVTRAIDNTDFESSNVEYIQFWVMDPFINKPGSTGGSLYFNLGDISEDILKDSRMFFENGIPAPFDKTKLDTTVWGYAPKFEQQITRAFDNDQTARELQDVGYDGLPDVSTIPGQLDERTKFSEFLTQLRQKLGATNPAYLSAFNDPSNDNYHFFRGGDYDTVNNNNGLSVIQRYKRYNNPQGNSPVTSPTASFSTAGTTIPESEDINRDNTLNEAESYFQYRIDMAPNMQVGTNYIIGTQDTIVKLPNGNREHERWYQFKIPIRNYDHKVGGISDFRSIRFMRMFLSGWQDSVTMRFATLELGRNQWRNYRYSLTTPGENVAQQNQSLTDFTVSSVSIEQNSSREPVHYVIPPGVSRQLTTLQQGVTAQLNEQSLSLKTCALQDGDARAVYKEVNVDMRQFTYLRVFMHAESMLGQVPVRDADVDAFTRLGSDFTNNYYEYRMPLTVTKYPGPNRDIDVWPASNEMDLKLQDLVDAKKERDAKGWPTSEPYATRDSKGNTIIVLGNPNIGGTKNVMLGVYNPKKSNKTPGDDGLAKCIEVWFDEMRMAGINDHAGYAAAGKIGIQLADLGNVNLSGSMHTPGYGNIDQKIEQRLQDNYYQFNTSTNLSLGRLMPRKWGVQLPMFVGYTQSVSTPKYDPYNQDVLLVDELNSAKSKAERDSIKNVSQDFTSIKSINFTNVRIQGNQTAPSSKPKMPWSIKNFDFSYSYNDQVKHNAAIELDNLETQKLGIGYNYGLKTKPIEPFKRIIKSKSKWFSLVKDINLTPLPSSFGLRNDLLRVNEETRVRSINDGSGYKIPPTYYKNFTWNRVWTLRWELMRSISFDYSATNVSRIDEPYGRINTPQKRDSLLNRIRTFGHNTSYNQMFNSTYNVPLSKLPLTDWLSLRLGYAANYSWTGVAPVAYELGNTIGNTQTKTVAGEMNMTTLYNKSRWLKAIGAPPKPKNSVNKTATPEISVPASDTKQNVKDLRKKSTTSALPGAVPVPGNDPVGGIVGNGNSVPGNNPGGLSAPAGRNPKSKPDNDPTVDNPAKTDSPKSNPGAVPATNGTDPANNNDPKGGVSNGKPGFIHGVSTANLSDEQLDSLIQLQKDEDRAKAAAEKAKKKAAKKAARKLRRSKLPQLSPVEIAIGRVLTMVSRVTVNYTETGGTILPGYMDSTRFMGVNNYSSAPGFDYVYGYQPNAAWLYRQAAAGRLTRDSLFNAQFQQTYSSNLSATAALSPIKDLRIDLTLTKTFTKSHNELYSDTVSTSNSQPYSANDFHHFNPYESGSFNISYLSVNTMFKNTGVSSDIYKEFLKSREVISRRLGAANPYTNGLPDPSNPGYTKGYGPFSQDVLVPAFIAAYSGKSAETQPLVDYNHQDVKANPFKNFIPTPNWKVIYNGLAKLPGFSAIFNTFSVNHGYTGTMSLNGFSSSLLFNDLYGLGFPSFIDSNSRNYVPFFQVPNVTISQAFTPLIGFDMGFKNNLTAKVELRKSKMESLSLIDYQIGENTSTEYVIGFGFRKKGIKLPFRVMGIKKLKNELICKMDISLRDDKTSNTFLANNINVVSRGQKVVRISPTIDYSVTQKLTLHFFFDRQQTIPYVSNSFPTTTTRAGVTLRFIFAQ